MKSPKVRRKANQEVNPRNKTEKLQPFDKYYYYQESVQSPENDVRFFRRVYRELLKSEPVILREDFCGTFQVCCEWVKLAANHRSIGIDLDAQPLLYGQTHHYQDLESEQQDRITLKQANVLDAKVGLADLTVALNFSYFLFRERKELVHYFKHVRSALVPGGLFLADCFGGPLCQNPNEEKTKKGDFTYYWDQVSFNPINQHATFYIHFQRKGEEKRKKVFRYDWRLWSVPEIRDAMTEAGFKNTCVYWEGTTKKGEGDGKFRRRERGDDCQSYIAYVAAWG